MASAHQQKKSLYACILVFYVVSSGFPTGMMKLWILDGSSYNFKLIKCTLKPLGFFLLFQCLLFSWVVPCGLPAVLQWLCLQN